ncbi:MAG: hypothetical protein RBT59_11595 [Arcobacteraceae bacterium]|jgi:cytochrome c peroxidase|nr:hypothetical protein [Arcobacteraceae bacterium]
MLKIITITLFAVCLSASDISQSLVEKQINESFITSYEYGKMLYNNPRGISCAKCHGQDAKGLTLSKFKHRTKDKVYNCEIKTEDITTVSLGDFKAKLDPDILETKVKIDKSDVCKKMIYGNTMPKYFLTQNEQESIYYYVTHINKK